LRAFFLVVFFKECAKPETSFDWLLSLRLISIPDLLIIGGFILALCFVLDIA
jgi:hypothetical protein